MKKTILHFVMITGCALLANLSSVAQNASAETKPATSTSTPGSAANKAPAPAPSSKILNDQDAKPITPGGEFKPRDTRAAMPAGRTKEYDEPKPALPNKTSNAPVSAPDNKEPVKSVPKAAEAKPVN